MSDNENQDRMRRVETKVTRIYNHLGLGSDTTMPIRVEKATMFKAAKAYISGYDVTLSQIKRALISSGEVDLERDAVDLIVNGECIARLALSGD